MSEQPEWAIGIDGLNLLHEVEKEFSDVLISMVVNAARTRLGARAGQTINIKLEDVEFVRNRLRLTSRLF